MANTYKNIVITPNTGSTTGDPTIVFSGGDANTNTDVTLRVYPTSNGTLSFEGTAGQLFSITNDLSNTIFSVNDVSGIPLIEVNVASQQITFGQFYGNVGIGTAAANSSNYKLDVTGGANISLPNLTVGGTNVIAAIVASNANAVTLSANVNTLAGAYATNAASQGANIATLAAAFVTANSTLFTNTQTLSANVNTLAAAYAANTVSLSANVNTLAAAFVANTQALSANDATQGANIAALAASFVSNSQTLSANVNTLAAAYAANTVSLSANVNTLAAAVVSNNATQGANIAALAANVNTIAGAITNLTLENLPGAFTKRSVTAATTANIALYGTQTIDGVAVVAGNRVLVKDQTLANQNGLYVVSATAWSRSADADVIGDIASALVAVDAGTVNGGKTYDNDLKITDTLETTSIVWNRIIDDGAIYTYAAPVTAYGALNVAYLAANTNAASQGANIAVLAASFVSNSQTLSANVNTLAATFVLANANSVSLSTNVNTLAATFVSANANNVSLSANINTLAATVAPNTAASRFAGTSNNADLLDGLHATSFLSNTSGVAFAGNLFFPTGNVGIGLTSTTTPLHIYKPSVALDVNYAKIEMPSWAGSAGKYKTIMWSDGQDVGGIGAVFDGTSVNFAIHSLYNSGYKTTSNIAMIIKGTGSVGIGNTNPNLSLEVSGNMSVNAFVEFSQTIATSYTITSGRNALTAGPVTINSGVTVTVPTGSYWTIV